MTAVAHVLPIACADALRLNFCPRCDYSLHGLPDAGICPECGRPYDQSFIVLRGRPRRDSDNHWAIQQRAFGPREALLSGASIVAMWIVLSLPTHEPLFILILPYFIVDRLLGLLAWYSSRGPGEVLVWISAFGIGQEPSEDPRLLASRIRSALRLLYPILILTTLFLNVRGLTYQPIIFFTVFVLVSVKQRFPFSRGWRGSKHGPDSELSLFEWKLVNTILLKRSEQGFWQLQARNGSRFSGTNFTNIEFQAASDTVVQLRRVLDQWCPQGAGVESSRTVKPGLARRFGRFVRGVFIDRHDNGETGKRN